jgi:hypothetical protein
MNQDTAYQERYWKELVQLKVHANYLDFYLLGTAQTSARIDGFLAISSSSSIGAWLVWRDWQFVWALVIAASQVINALKSHLPYWQRLKSLSGLVQEFDDLVLFAEERWFDVSEGRLSDEEIHRLHMEVKRRRSRLVNKHLGPVPLPFRDKMFRKAQEQAQLHFDNFYP